METDHPVSGSGHYETLKVLPQYLYSFVDKYVEAKLIKNITFKGFVQSIDPVTYSIILSVPKEQTYQTTIVPGHAVLELTCIPPGDLQPPPKHTPITDDEEAKNRKEKLIAWFKWNLLPVQEFDDKIIVQSVNILSPYTTSNIYAENPVVTLQIRKIMEKMSTDFVPS